MDLHGEIIRTASTYDNQIQNKDKLGCITVSLQGLNTIDERSLIVFPTQVNLVKAYFFTDEALPDLGASPTDYSILEVINSTGSEVIATLDLGTLTTAALGNEEFTIDYDESLLDAGTSIYIQKTDAGSGQTIPESNIILYFEVI
jgi:hypothetical protein